MTRRIAVYGEIDPNLVDGSSVWLQSVCQVLGSIDGVAVTLLLRRPLQPERRFLLGALAAHPAVELVDAGRPELLGPGEALDELARLERERGRFDLVLLRGQAVLAEAAERDAFDGRLWSYAMPGRGMPDETLRTLAARSARLLCQTEAAAEELRRIVPEANGSLLTLPPMIPDLGPPPARNGAARPLRLAYSGKLAPEYCWLETVEAFAALRAAEPGAELHVLGDKIHRPPAQSRLPRAGDARPARDRGPALARRRPPRGRPRPARRVRPGPLRPRPRRRVRPRALDQGARVRRRRPPRRAQPRPRLRAPAGRGLPAVRRRPRRTRRAR